MMVLAVALTVYFFKIKRRQRFEITILVCIFVKYTCYMLNQDKRILKLENNSAFYVPFYTFATTLGPISHWIFSSQYIKTCFLI